MQVYLLRHGISEEGRAGQSDSDRALTAEGRKRLTSVLKKAARAEVRPTLILSSPLKRAIQTAEIAKQVFSYSKDILRTKVLSPGSAVEQVWDEIRVHKDEPALLLVGHNPLFENLTGYLLGQQEMNIDFKKGAILRVDFEAFGAQPKGVLRWYLTARLAANRQ